MRNTQEQLQEVLKRSERIRALRRLRQRMLLDGAGLLVCLILLVTTAIVIPGMSDSVAQNGHWQYGSLFLDSHNVGYFVIGMLAFAMGVFAVLLGVHWRQLLKEKREKR